VLASALDADREFTLDDAIEGKAKRSSESAFFDFCSVAFACPLDPRTSSKTGL
jgi:hypothetical protein